MKRKLSLSGLKYIDEDGVHHISRSIDSIDDLIEMSDMYRYNKRYNIDLWKICSIRSSLMKLKRMVGLTEVKRTIVKQIIYFLQGFHNDDMLHTVIQGPPGVGKTMLAQIIGEIYHHMNIFNKEDNDEIKFVIARRSDLIGEYLGTTAKKTQGVIDACKGGVLLIDEAYALGNKEGKDIYSKECIDTLNQNLSENKNNFLCIIAGYKSSLERSFFSYNEGLRRRFPFVYTLSKYSVEELVLILKDIFEREGWKLCDSNKSIQQILQAHYAKFENMAGDMETIALNTKLEHSERVLFLHPSVKRSITAEDVRRGVDKFLRAKKECGEEEEEKPVMSHMYM